MGGLAVLSLFFLSTELLHKQSGSGDAEQAENTHTAMAMAHTCNRYQGINPKESKQNCHSK